MDIHRCRFVHFAYQYFHPTKQGQTIQHNPKAGVIVSAGDLAIQGVTRQQAGNYSCIASNVEGDGESNTVGLKVMCKYETDIGRRFPCECTFIIMEMPEFWCWQSQRILRKQTSRYASIIRHLLCESTRQLDSQSCHHNVYTHRHNKSVDRRVDIRIPAQTRKHNSNPSLTISTAQHRKHSVHIDKARRSPPLPESHSR